MIARILNIKLIMKIYIIRHGQDDASVRGGWSNTSLTALGIQQSNKLADELFQNQSEYNIFKIYSSDLKRARQTAQIIADKLSVPIEFISDFREVDNGELAGMDNYLAEEKYPNLYWRKLNWDEHYPNGESPKEFYKRVNNAWEKFIKEISHYDKNVLLVTHGGVINIITCIIDGKEYSNKNKNQKIPSAEIAVEAEV